MRVSRIHLLKRMTEEEKPIQMLKQVRFDYRQCKQKAARKMDLHDIERRVDATAGRLRLLCSRVDGREDWRSVARRIARHADLVFGRHGECVL